MTRPLALLLALSLTLPLFAASELRIVEIHSPRHFFLAPGAAVTYEVAVTTIGDPVADAVFTMPLPPGSRFVEGGDGHPPFVCGEAAGVVTCRAPQLSGYTNLWFRIAAPAEPGRYVSRMTLSARDTAPAEGEIALDVLRTLVVTSNADAGPGSLRDAIEQMNATCGNDGGPCHITFNLGEQNTIVLREPLPWLTACRSRIDAGAAEIWPDLGPRRVTIDGSLLTYGNGLTIRSACDPSNIYPSGLAIRGIALERFPHNGIFFAASERKHLPTRHAIEHVHVSGAGVRGLATFDPNASITVQRSVFRANRHSGVFLFAGPDAYVSECVLRDNGKSGIFTNVAYSSLRANEIVNNDDFGIAIAGSTRYVVVTTTSMFGNRNVGIDRGLDGPTPQQTPGQPNAPRILDARYDAVQDKTLITVAIAESEYPFGRYARILLYASREVSPSGHVEAERLIGSAEGWAGGGAREIAIAGDLRGQFVTAMANLYGLGDEPYADATELSAGVGVR